MTISRRGAAVFVVLFAGSLFSLSAEAEKKKVTWTYKFGDPEKMSALEPKDVPGHLLAQWERRDTITSTDPEWNGTEQVMYTQVDEIAGSGIGKDYGIQSFKNGDVAYLRLDTAYTGTYKVNGAWEGTVEGILRYMGGTGKYKNIRGSAAVHCKGIDPAFAKEVKEGAGGCTLVGEVEY